MFMSSMTQTGNIQKISAILFDEKINQKTIFNNPANKSVIDIKLIIVQIFKIKPKNI